MPKAKVLTRSPLKVEVEIAPSILREDMPARSPLKVEVEIAPSILREGGPTRPRLSGEPEPEPTEPELSPDEPIELEPGADI